MGVADLCAGGPSIIILIHNICIAFNGFGKLSIVDTATSVNAAMLLYSSVTIATDKATLTCSTEIEGNF